MIDFHNIILDQTKPLKRSQDPLALAGATGGLIICFVAVLFLPGFVSAYEQKKGQNEQEPFEYIEARLLKFGEIKDDKKLPDRIVPALPTAPKEVLALDTNEKKPEPPKKEKKPERQADAVDDDKLRQVFDKARAFAEIQDDYVPEGHPDGVPDGDVTDPALASLGATYGRRITRYIKERWVVPTLISDAQRKKLAVKIVLKFNVDMMIISFKIVKKSGNLMFDDSVTNAIDRLRKEVKHLPAPPEVIAPRIYSGGLAITLHGADAPSQ
jgi:hypothetical protein